MPYYLLIVADPRRIPYRFQYQLDVEYAVGRLWFETDAGQPDLEAFAHYARSVVTAETGAGSLPRRAVFVGVRNDDDGATSLSESELVRPLPADLKGDLKPADGDWQFVLHSGPEADKARFARLLGGEETPALLFTASHGMGFPSGHSKQLAQQGGLLCQNWPGPRNWFKAIPEDFYFWAGDVPDSARLLGLIAFHFACYGAGTPELDDFPESVGALQRAGIAPRPFVARLPQRLLGHPKGGALAVIGHVERAWTTSFLGDGQIGPQLQAFEDTLGRLMQGYPVGYAMEAFNIRYAALSELLSTELQEIDYGGVRNDLLLSNLWTSNNDARNYAVIGDPAVRLMVNGRPPATPRPTIEATAPAFAPAPATSAAPVASSARTEPGAGGLTFEPPAGFRDQSEYSFTGPSGRWLTITAAGPELATPELLLTAARAYAQQLVDLFNIPDSAISPVQLRKDGASFVTVATHFPSSPEGRIVRVALIRFPNGQAIRVMVSGPENDSAAEADFQRVVKSAEPAAAATPRVAFAVGAPAAVSPVRATAGPTSIELPPGYQDTTRLLTFHNPTDSAVVRVQVMESAMLRAESFAPGPTSLFHSTQAARDEAGEPFAYEVPPTRAASFGAVAPAPAIPGTEEKVIGSRRIVVEARSTDAGALAKTVIATIRPVGQ